MGGSEQKPPGYKQTEIGAIPVDWRVRRLGELGEVVRGGSPRPAGDPRFFHGTFIPWLTVAALTTLPEYCLRVTKTTGSLTEEGAKYSRVLPPETLIIANSGATLGVAKILGLTCCANDGIAAILEQTSGDQRFLCQYINTQSHHLRDVVAPGNGQPNLNTALIRQIPVPYPPSAEQRAIAEALSDVDRLHGALDSLIAKKHAIKQAAVQQLINGKTRLPGFSGDWKTKRLGECLTVRHGRNQSAVSVAEGRYPILASGGEIGRTNTPLYDKPSVLIGRKGTIDEPKYAPTPFWTVDTLFYTEMAKNYSATFMYYLFCTIPWRNYNEASGVPSLNARTIENISADLPRHDEQTAIATVLSGMDAEIEALERRREKTRAIKQGMMQQLLTGRIRLIQPDLTETV